MTNKATRVLVIGAGVAGQMVVEEIRRHPETNYQPIAFIDDDPLKNGLTIAGLPVVGGCNDILPAVKKGQIDEILIAIPSATGRVIRSIIDHCEKTSVRFRIVPGIYKIIKGDVQIENIREVHPADLLGRETVRLNTGGIAAYLKDKTILITGGGGSIGSEIARQAALFAPKRLLLFCRGENSLFEIENELRENHPELDLVPIIGDILDRSRVNHIFQKFQPRVLFHAAAHKHVVIMEENPTEAVKNNVLGTQVLAEAAVLHGVERFIMLSTDKAVNPVSVMGASKRIAEFFIQGLSREQEICRFMTVRFGNVLGSRGSVVPRFLAQIKKRKPLTITDPEAVRYFMTIAEAARLVLQAGAIGEGGEIFVLDMGEPIKIGRLARQLIILSGLRPDEDISIKTIGLRQGEKLREELLTSREELDATRHQNILRARPDRFDGQFLSEQLASLADLAEKNDDNGVLAVIGNLLPCFSEVNGRKRLT